MRHSLGGGGEGEGGGEGGGDGEGGREGGKSGFGEAEGLGDDFEGGEEVDGDGEGDIAGPLYDYDFLQKAAATHDPAHLWDGAPEEFPDPHSNVSGFLQYCGLSEEDFTAFFYLLTPQLMGAGPATPLASHESEVIFCESTGPC